MTDPVLRKTLLTAALQGSASVTHLHVAEVTLAPGVATGRHHHLMNVVGYVTKGTILFQVEASPARSLSVGEAFHEPAASAIGLCGPVAYLTTNCPALGDP